MDLEAILSANKKAKEQQAKIVPIARVVSGKPEPIIISSPSQPALSAKDYQRTVDVYVDTENHKAKLLKELWEKDRQLRIPRAKLSSQISRMIDENAPAEKRREHYAKIEVFRPELQANYDMIRFVEKFGHMPVEPQPQPRQYTEDINALKVLRQSLREEISKTKKKIQLKAGKSDYSSWKSHWEEKLAIAQASLLEISEKIKRLNGQ